MRAAFVTLAGLALLAAGCGREREPVEQERSRPAAPAGLSPAASAVADDRPVIVAFGDSLTAGQGVDPALSYPAVLERAIEAKGHRYRVVNAGVSGDTTSGGVARLDAVLALKPRIVIVALGANDGLRGLPVENIRANLEQITMTLQGAGAKVVLAGMTLPPNYGPDYVRSFEHVFEELAKKHGAPLVPFLLEGVAARPDRMQGDGLHPNAAGQRIVAANVLRALEPLL